MENDAIDQMSDCEVEVLMESRTMVREGQRRGRTIGQALESLPIPDFAVALKSIFAVMSASTLRVFQDCKLTHLELI